MKKPVRISAENMEKLASIMAKETGGDFRIRDKGTLQYIAEEVNKEDDPCRQASIALYHITTKHPLFDGNKRLGILTAMTILAEYGYKLEEDVSKAVRFILDVAQDKKSIDEIEKWFKKRRRKL